MEIELFDAYKLSRWMCPSNYNRFSDRAKYWSKIVIFSYPLLHSTPRYGGSRRNIAISFGTEKLEWWDYLQVVKHFYQDIFSAVDRIPACVRRTDGQTDILRRHSPRYTCASRGKNPCQLAVPSKL